MHAIVSKLSPHATDLIRADRARVLATFHRYKSDAQPATKQALAGAPCLSLEVHAQIEEEIFYPAMGSVDSPLVGKLIPEHDQMRSRIAALRNPLHKPEAADPQYDATVMELMGEVIHYIADVEAILLPEAERVHGARMMTRHKARAMPKSNLLVQHVRRYA